MFHNNASLEIDLQLKKEGKNLTEIMTVALPLFKHLSVSIHQHPSLCLFLLSVTVTFKNIRTAFYIFRKISKIKNSACVFVAYGEPNQLRWLDSLLVLADLVFLVSHPDQLTKPL